MVVALDDARKREHAGAAERNRGLADAIAAPGRLIEYESKPLIEPADGTECRQSGLDICRTRARRHRSAAPIPLVLNELFVAAVSMIATVQPSLRRWSMARSMAMPLSAGSMQGSGLVRRRPQFEIVPCGSASIMPTRWPASIAAIASPTASVLLPQPPF